MPTFSSMSAATTGNGGTDQARRGTLLESVSGWYTTVGSILSGSDEPAQQISDPYNFRHDAGFVGSSGDIMLRDMKISTAQQNAAQGENLGATARAQNDGTTAVYGESGVQNEHGIGIQAPDSAQTQAIADTINTGIVQTHARGFQRETIRTESRDNNYGSLSLVPPNVISPVGRAAIGAANDLEAGVREHTPAGGISGIAMSSEASENDGGAWTRLKKYGGKAGRTLVTGFCLTAGWFEACLLTIYQALPTRDQITPAAMRDWCNEAYHLVKTKFFNVLFYILMLLVHVSAFFGTGNLAVGSWITIHETAAAVPAGTTARFLLCLLGFFASFALLLYVIEHRAANSKIQDLIDWFKRLCKTERVIFGIFFVMAECSILSIAAFFGVLHDIDIQGLNILYYWYTPSSLLFAIGLIGMYVFLVRSDTRRPRSDNGDRESANGTGLGGGNDIELSDMHRNNSTASLADRRSNSAGQNSLAPVQAGAHGPPRRGAQGLAHASQASQNNDSTDPCSRASMIGIARSDSLIGDNGHASMVSTITSVGNTSIQSFGTEQPVLGTALSVAQRRVQLVSSPSIQAQSSSSLSTIPLQVLPQSTPETGAVISVPRLTYNPSKSPTPCSSNFGGSDTGSGFTVAFGSSSSGTRGYGIAWPFGVSDSRRSGAGPTTSSDPERSASAPSSHTRSPSEDTLSSLLDLYHRRTLWLTDETLARPGDAVLKPNRHLRSHPAITHPTRKIATPQSAVFCDASNGSRV